MHPELDLSAVLFQISLHIILQLGIGLCKTSSNTKIIIQHGRDDELSHAYRRSESWMNQYEIYPSRLVSEGKRLTPVTDFATGLKGSMQNMFVRTSLLCSRVGDTRRAR